MKDRIIEIFIGLVIFVAMMIAAVYHSDTGEVQANTTEKPTFSESSCIAIYVDEETGVNYVVYRISNRGGITPRYNADGTLYIEKEGDVE